MRARVVVVAIGLLIGIGAGVGSYTFIYAKGYSYLTNDPAACANCHVMNDYYAAWLKGPHRSVAACNDCHTEITQAIIASPAHGESDRTSCVRCHWDVGHMK